MFNRYLNLDGSLEFIAGLHSGRKMAVCLWSLQQSRRTLLLEFLNRMLRLRAEPWRIHGLRLKSSPEDPTTHEALCKRKGYNSSVSAHMRGRRVTSIGFPVFWFDEWYLSLPAVDCEWLRVLTLDVFDSGRNAATIKASMTSNEPNTKGGPGMSWNERNMAS